MVSFEKFEHTINTVWKYMKWERELYDFGIDLMDTPVGYLIDGLWGLLTEDTEYDYDPKEGISWVMSAMLSPNLETVQFKLLQVRFGRKWDISTLRGLYDFLEYANVVDWEEDE